MSVDSWLQSLRSTLAPGRSQRHLRRRGSVRAATHRLNVEVLEDRLTLSFTWGGLYPIDEFYLRAPDFTFADAAGPGVTADFNGEPEKVPGTNRTRIFTKQCGIRGFVE
jgi:hypothetical protein